MKKKDGLPRTLKDILFINPPSFFLTDDKVFFSLGLLNIAAVAREEGHRVSLEDLAGREDYLERMREIAAQKKYDLYGLTATSPQFGYAKKILGAIKSVDPKARVVLGGPHANMFADLRRKILDKISVEGNMRSISPESLEKILESRDVNFASLKEFDQIVTGEEEGIFEAIADLDNNDPRKWVYSKITQDLDVLPLPARDLINMRDYTFKEDGKPKFDLNGGPATSVIMQRGCPFNCLFCSGRNVPQYRSLKVGNKFRTRSPEKIIEEFNHLNRIYGFERFMFYDDELNVVPKHFMLLMDRLIENNELRRSLGQAPFKFRGFVKSELFVKHPEQASYMKKAGFDELLSGFESGSDRILNDFVRKNTTREINIEAARLALSNKMKVKALTMVGHPSETYEDLMMTQSFLEEIGEMAEQQNSSWQFDLTVLTPYPGSPIYDGLKPNRGEWAGEYPLVYGDRDLFMKKIDFGKDEGVGAYKSAPGEEKVLIRTPYLSGRDLLEFRNHIDKEVRRKFNVKGYERRDIITS